MPADSFPFPMFSGLLTPDHCKKIGSALWLFVWCISSTTAEVEDDGTVWGIVLGGKPMKLSEIGANFGVKDKTVSRWISDLQDHGYLHITRAPRGLIIKVKNSKKSLLKRSDKNVPSLKCDQTKMSDQNESDQTKMSVHGSSDQTEMSDQNASEQTKMSDHEPNLGSDQTKMSDAKDIKDLITITTVISEKEWWEEEQNSTPPSDGMIAILNAYCQLHKKIDTNVSALERQAMNQMVAGGMPVPFTIETMKKMYKAKQKRDKDNFYQPNSFAYYVSGIEEAWRNTNAVQPTPPKKTTPRNGKQDKLADLRRRAEEERKLEESASH